MPPLDLGHRKCRRRECKRSSGYRSSAYGLGPDDPAFFEWRRSSPVTLGHDVWIGHGAVVLPSVSIGNGAAVGAGAIVTKDVPPFAVVAGNPARVVREL